MTNIQRTLDYIRGIYHEADIDFTERKIPHTHIKKDLYGIIDLVVLVADYSVCHPEFFLYGIQVCGGNDYAIHMKKILASRSAYMWTYGRGRKLMLIGWRRLKKEGWVSRIHSFTRGDWLTMPPAPSSVNLKCPDVSLL